MHDRLILDERFNSLQVVSVFTLEDQYNGISDNESMLQRTVLIIKVRILQRMNIYMNLYEFYSSFVAF